MRGEGGAGATSCLCPPEKMNLLMRESNRNLDIPPPGIPGEFACLVFEEGGNLTFFLVEGGEFAYGVGNLNFSFKHMPESKMASMTMDEFKCEEINFVLG